MDPASMGSDHCKKDDLFCLEMDGYVEVPSLGLSASANIMVGRSGFHMAATAALGTGLGSASSTMDSSPKFKHYT